MAAVKLMVLLAFFAGTFVLSTDAVRCLQCNSYLDPGCADLDLKTGGPQGDKYLKECSDASTFCRKLDVTMLVNEERRIIRSCGQLVPKYNNTNLCFRADNEGYKETICQCYGDACNTATTSIRKVGLSSLVFGLLCFLCIHF